MSKHDKHAVALWGRAYDAVPKSVFATVAWHLANETSGQPFAPGSAVSRFLAELYALGAGDVINQDQVRNSSRALCKARKG